MTTYGTINASENRAFDGGECRLARRLPRLFKGAMERFQIEVLLQGEVLVVCSPNPSTDSLRGEHEPPSQDRHHLS